MNNSIFSIIILGLIIFPGCNNISPNSNLPRLEISDNNRYIVTENGEPFFWLGGTAWELFHRLNREEATIYLEDRASKGFTVIQAVILAELDGLNTPNAYGETPLINNDPTKPNEKYFEHVDFIVKKAEELGMYIGLLPTWGDKFNIKWGAGPEVFTEENAEVYGLWLAQRYVDQSNIIWLLGGDRPIETELHRKIIEAMAKSIHDNDPNHLMTYHPNGANKATDYFNKSWLDFDMYQSGHSRISKEYEYVFQSFGVEPKRPVINGEARYENIPDRFWEQEERDWLNDADVRTSAYWSMFAGAAGYTYGSNDIWQMNSSKNKSIIRARTSWNESIHLPGSKQMLYMKELLSSFPWQTLQYDPGLFKNENPEDAGFIMGMITSESDVALIYTPLGKPILTNLSKLKTPKIQAFWFNPRDGKSEEIGIFEKDYEKEFKPKSWGKGSDYILVLMSVGSRYTLPN